VHTYAATSFQLKNSVCGNCFTNRIVNLLIYFTRYTNKVVCAQEIMDVDHITEGVLNSPENKMTMGPIPYRSSTNIHISQWSYKSYQICWCLFP
jgi:hypothetical protein